MFVYFASTKENVSSVGLCTCPASSSSLQNHLGGLGIDWLHGVWNTKQVNCKLFLVDCRRSIFQMCFNIFSGLVILLKGLVYVSNSKKDLQLPFMICSIYIKYLKRLMPLLIKLNYSFFFNQLLDSTNHVESYY